MQGNVKDYLTDKDYTSNGIYPPRPVVFERPSDWPANPSFTTSDQKFVGLLGISPDGDNYIALSAEGNFTVDWGDGNPPTNHTSAATAERTYDFAAVAGSATSQGFKVVVVTLTPDGGDLTKLDLNIRHSKAGLIGGHGTQWIEWHIGSPNFASGQSIVTTTGSATLANNPVLHHWLKRAKIYNIGSTTEITALFLYCTQLEVADFDLVDTINVTGMGSMFFNCKSITELPDFETRNVTSFVNFASVCTSLVRVPLYNTGNVTTFSSAFRNCNKILSIPDFNMASATNLTAMFSGCQSLIQVPPFNSTIATTLTEMFLDCSSLRNAPEMSFAACTSAARMFSGCRNLLALPTTLNFSSLSGLNSAIFTDCQSLRKTPAINFGGNTSMASVFSGCLALEEVGAITAASANSTGTTFQNCQGVKIYGPITINALIPTFTGMFQNNYSLMEVPSIDCSTPSTGSPFGNMFALNYSLTRNQAFGFRRTISLINTKMDRDALVEFFTNLGTSTPSGQIVTVTNTPGASVLSAADELIATAKGWTVTK